MLVVISTRVRSFTAVPARVIVRALHAFEAFLFFTLHRLVQIWMEQLLLPPVAVAACL